MTGSRTALALVASSVFFSLAAPAPVLAQGLSVSSVSPVPESMTASVWAPIVVTFDKPVAPSSVVALQSFWAFGRSSGTVIGTITFSNGNHTVTLTPTRQLAYGESVMVILSHDIEAADASTLRSGGYSFQFHTRARHNSMVFAEATRMGTRTYPEAPTRSYGGIGGDVNEDGFADITIVNEFSADLRVFLNQATGNGLFDPFLTPTFPTQTGSSANETSDFNRDGHIDFCTANIDSDSVSILLGNGDGTFAPTQHVAVGATPLGIAVLDVDGDGDVDIVNTNVDSDNLSLLLNDGNGVFAAPVFLEGGDSGERALSAGDMNGDGLLDLVVGFLTAKSVVVDLSNGDGTFSPQTPRVINDLVWMLVLGDLDGNGTVDVATADGQDDRGAILLGDGSGGLGPPQFKSPDPFLIATDLGDLDGDGDLDWVLSSFAGDWTLYLNDGNGSFTLGQTFPSTLSASCSLIFDFDNDGDLDLALIDEREDEFIVMRNEGVALQAIPMLPPRGIGLLVLALLVAGSAVLAYRRTRVADS